jgi:hypothetical protein
VQETTPSYITSNTLLFQIPIQPLPGLEHDDTIGISTSGILFNNETGEYSYTFTNTKGTNILSELNVYEITFELPFNTTTT